MSDRRLRPVKKDRPCPVCGNDHACAFVGEDGVICYRVQEGCKTDRDGNPITAKGGMGWLHAIGSAKGKGIRPARAVGKSKPPKHLTPQEIRALLKQHREDLNLERLTAFAAALGLSVGSLKAYGVGYDRKSGCYSFPMYDGSLERGKWTLCGIRLRRDDSTPAKDGAPLRYGCVLGSRNGLFIPKDYAERARPIPAGAPGNDSGGPMLLLLPEGPTSSAAAFDLGFNAVGRFNNQGGGEQVVRMLRNSPGPQAVVILADDEGTKWRKDPATKKPTEPHWPGWEGALRVAEDVFLSPACASLQIIRPPEKAKDLREWLINKGVAGLLQSVITDAPAVTPEWLAHQKRIIETCRAVVRHLIVMRPEADVTKVLEYARLLIREKKADAFLASRKRQKVPA
jgi:hypothetical protein